jgi:hypothetical protein
MNWNPYQTSYRNTASVANNQRAASQQQAAGKVYGGQGLGIGKGQKALDQYQDSVASAQGNAAARTAFDQDRTTNQQNAIQASLGRRNEQLSYDSLAEQMRQSQWDSRFNNLTSAWGALAGLLR